MADAFRPNPDPEPTTRTSLAPASAAPSKTPLFIAGGVFVVALVAGVLLLRRPKADSAAASDADEDDGPAPSAVAPIATPSAPAFVPTSSPGPAPSAGGITVSEPRLVSCHDKGKKRTAPEQCDKVVALEQALVRAIEQSSSCVPPAAGGGSLEYLADISFVGKKKPVSISIAKKGSSLRNKKARDACRRAVADALAGLPLADMKHEHARYKMSVLATYPGPHKK